MWYCTECKSTFTEPKIITDYVTNDPYPMGPTISVCPFCHSDMFVEAIECSCCGSYIAGEYIQTKDNSYYCEDCYTVCDNTEV